MTTPDPKVTDPTPVQPVPVGAPPAPLVAQQTNSSALTQTAAVSGGGAAGVVVLKWMFMGCPLPPPDTVLTVMAAALVPLVHALGLLVMGRLKKRLPPT